tara:strand:+ start:1642 stop:1989 length:348 start_codon:yes stop_codon:yes gene_type:complete
MSGDSGSQMTSALLGLATSANEKATKSDRILMECLGFFLLLFIKSFYLLSESSLYGLETFFLALASRDLLSLCCRTNLQHSVCYVPHKRPSISVTYRLTDYVDDETQSTETYGDE